MLLTPYLSKRIPCVNLFIPKDVIGTYLQPIYEEKYMTFERLCRSSDYENFGSEHLQTGMVKLRYHIKLRILMHF